MEFYLMFKDNSCFFLYGETELLLRIFYTIYLGDRLVKSIKYRYDILNIENMEALK